MKTHTKIALSSIPVLMIMANVSYAEVCTSPCEVNAAENPKILLNDTTNGNTQDWEIEQFNEGSGNSVLRFGVNGVSNSFIIEDDAPTNTLVVDDVGRIGIGTRTPDEELQINAAAPTIRLTDISGGGALTTNDFNLKADQARFVIENVLGHNIVVVEADTGGNTNLYVDDDGDIGLGVVNPTSDLQFDSNNDEIRFGTGASGWRLDSNSNTFEFESLTGGTTIPFRIEDAPSNSLVVNFDGSIGMGTSTPVSTLHITENDARVTIDDTNNATSSGVLLELNKAGVPAFRLTNTTNNSSWDFTQRPNQNFALSKAGSGQFEVQIEPDGDMLVAGSVTANGILLTSSRASKTDFSEIKSSDVMKKLSMIKVEEWRYKQADKHDRHISPMAEDFYSLFKLGPDNKHINPNDLASVAIIAAKELQKENDSLKNRLVSLEKLVTNLASYKSVLEGKGNKVALK